jgi:uncharacterized phage protein (TIGR02218 family)
MATGATTVCTCWSVTRTDGVVLGFTDHDRDLSFGGVSFRAASGMTARTLSQTNGLSVDNSEAMGALSSAAINEADLLAGRYDGADIQSWVVNWQDVTQRFQTFRGSFGEVVRSAGAFRAELRGLADRLNQVQGLSYQRNCTAVLGDGRCGFSLATAGYAVELAIVAVEDGVYRVAKQPGMAEGWFDRGRAKIVSGAARGQVGLIKFDRDEALARRVELWVDFAVAPQVGDVIRLEAGCDKLASTCRTKFGNFMNFRGFPHIPGADWMTSYPVSDGTNDGSSLFA